MTDELADLGEFGLIRRLLQRVPAGEGLVTGPGDDAAVLEARAGRALLATADLLIEGAHFDLALSSYADVGYKALTVNVSDIAAMGGTPLYALISLGAPASSSVEALEALYDGIAEAARAFGVAIAGGDTISSERLIVSIAVIGEAGADAVVRRDGARAGDVLCVTGELGGAAAGLALLRASPEDHRARELLAEFPGLAQAHRRARARVREGVGAARAGARAMIDISDGLAQDVGHICEASGVGVQIETAELRLAPGVSEVAQWAGHAAQRFALSGGDDYELAMAVPLERVPKVAAAVAPVPLTTAGRFVEPGTGDDAAHGWDHFR